MSGFTAYDSAQSSSILLQRLFGASYSMEQFHIVADSISLTYGTVSSYDYNTSSYTYSPSIGYFDSDPGIGLSRGIILSTGSATPPNSNTSSSYGSSFSETFGSFSGTDQLNAIAAAAFSSVTIYNTTALEFDFTISDQTIKGVSFDLIFGSDEYPEFVDSSYIDIGAVIINGVNYALFNNSPLQPLSILGNNLAAGNYYDNSAGTLPIEYDGISPKLSITAPVQQGLNHISIAVADTGDSIYDSAIMISNMTMTNYAGQGVAPIVTPATINSTLTDVEGNQYYEIPTGYFTKINISTTMGDDVINADNGYAIVTIPVSLAGLLGYEITSNSIVLNTQYGTKTITGTDIVSLTDFVAAFDTNIGGKTYDAMSLLYAGFGAAPDIDSLSKWTAQAIGYNNTSDLADAMINFYTGGVAITNNSLVTLLYQNIFASAVTEEVAGLLSSLAANIGTGLTYETQGTFLAYAADLAEVTSLMNIDGVVGSIQILSPEVFWSNVA